MKNTPNYANKIINRLEKGLPLTWEEMDGNDLYGNIWETNFEYKTSMVVLWNDYIGSNNDTGRMSFWMCRINHKSEDTKKPGTSGGNTYWDRIDTFPINTTNDNNIITLNMSDGSGIVFDLTNQMKKYRADTYSDDSNTPNYSGPWDGYSVLTPTILWTWYNSSGWVDNYADEGIWYINGTNSVYVSNGDILEVYEITNFSESSQRISADAILSTSILNEKTQRISTDTYLYSLLSFTGQTELSGETLQRILADESLANRISTETNTRLTADTSLANLISTESYIRLSGDTVLTNTLTNRISTEEFVRLTAISTELSQRVSTDLSINLNKLNMNASRTIEYYSETLPVTPGSWDGYKVLTSEGVFEWSTASSQWVLQEPPTDTIYYTSLDNKVFIGDSSMGVVYEITNTTELIQRVSSDTVLTNRISTEEVSRSVGLSTELSQRVSTDLFINSKIDNQYGQIHIPISGVTTNIIDGGLSENTKSAKIFIEARCAGVGVNVKEIYITNFNSTLSYQTSFTPTYSVNLYNFTIDYGLSDTIYINVNTLYNDVYFYYKKDILI